MKNVNRKEICENHSTPNPWHEKKGASCIITICIFSQWKRGKNKKSPVQNCSVQTLNIGIGNELFATYQNANNQFSTGSHTRTIANLQQ